MVNAANPKVHQAFDRVFLGFRAKSIDHLGICLEYTDPMRTREGATAYLRTHLTFRSRGWKKMIIVKVYSRIPRQLSYKKALEDLLKSYTCWEDIKEEAGLPEDRCKEIWALGRG